MEPENATNLDLSELEKLVASEKRAAERSRRIQIIKGAIPDIRRLMAVDQKHKAAKG